MLWGTRSQIPFIGTVESYELPSFLFFKILCSMSNTLLPSYIWEIYNVGTIVAFQRRTSWHQHWLDHSVFSFIFLFRETKLLSIQRPISRFFAYCKTWFFPFYNKKFNLKARNFLYEILGLRKKIWYARNRCTV